MRKQYRLKYNLLRERCDAIRQDNEQLVSRIWQVFLYKQYSYQRVYCGITHIDGAKELV